MEPPSLSVQVSAPLWATAPSITPFTFAPGGYQHTLQATGGYWSAQFKVPPNRLAVEDWLADGLGRHIVVRDDTLTVCWEGFVNQVDAQVAGLSLTRGPLLDVGNGLWVCYNPVIESVYGTVSGSRTYTEYEEDTDSQGRWGIREKVVTAGTMSELCAEYVRDVWLADNAEPATTQSFGTGREISATVNCLGYWHLLDWPYVQLTTGGNIDISNPTTPASGKMQCILADEPNGIFSTDYTQMATNAIDVEAWENSDTPANEILKTLAAMGDTSNNRYTIGIYAGRRCWYAAAPTATAYHQVLSGPKQLIVTPEGTEVKPWAVLPGRWLFYPDLMVGRQTPADKRQDLRYEFVESVTYNSEGNPAVSHQGGKFQSLPQVMARWGLGSV